MPLRASVFLSVIEIISPHRNNLGDTGATGKPCQNDVSGCTQSCYFELMKGGAHAASCLGTVGFCEPTAICVISTELLLP